jgi:hypothetical protein
MTLRKAKYLFLGIAAVQLSLFLSMNWNGARAADTVSALKGASKEKKAEVKASDVPKNVENTVSRKEAAPKANTASRPVVKQESKPSSAVEKVPAGKAAAAKGTSGAEKKPDAKAESTKADSKASDKKTDAKPSDKNADGKTSDKKAKGDKPHRKAKETVLVPPPPPATPSFLPEQMSDLGEIGPLDYLSKEDLKFKLDNLNKKLTAAKQDQKDQEDMTREIKGKAERFDSLFAEGVVSKRELETSKRDAERSERDLERTNIKVSELQRITETVQERLTKVEAASKPKAVKSIARKAVPVRKKKTALGKKISN